MEEATARAAIRPVRTLATAALPATTFKKCSPSPQMPVTDPDTTGDGLGRVNGFWHDRNAKGPASAGPLMTFSVATSRQIYAQPLVVPQLAHL